MARISKKTVTGRRERQLKHRIEAAKLFDLGKTRAEVSQALGVTWISANNWYKAWQEEGVAALNPKGRPGPPAKFSDEEAQRIVEELKRGSMAHGYKNEIWTLRRVGSLIRERTGKKTSPSEVWRLLRRVGWSVQKPERKAQERSAGTDNQNKTVQDYSRSAGCPEMTNNPLQLQPSEQQGDPSKLWRSGTVFSPSDCQPSRTFSTGS